MRRTVLWRNVTDVWRNVTDIRKADRHVIFTDLRTSLNEQPSCMLVFRLTEYNSFLYWNEGHRYPLLFKHRSACPEFISSLIPSIYDSDRISLDSKATQIRAKSEQANIYSTETNCCHTSTKREKITVRGRKTDIKSGSTQQLLTLIQATQPTDVTALWDEETTTKYRCAVTAQITLSL